MKKQIKSITTKLCMLVTAGMLIVPVVNAYAVDSRVTSSSVWVDYNSTLNTSRAEGYVIASEYHYCSVKLFRFGQEMAYSGRIWGYDDVWNATSAVACGPAGAAMDGSAVYYGF